MNLSSLWGKARPHLDNQVTAHPLVAHALDVAAVAMLLPDADRLNLDRRCLGFFVSLHDIGKISRAFQAQAPAHWPASILGPVPDAVPGFPHDVMGLHLLTHTVQTELEPAFLPDAKGRRSWVNPLLQALAGHHGRPADDGIPNEAALGPLATAAAKAFVAAMRDAFRPPPLPCPGRDRAVERLGWQLAGLVTLADWIGSRQEWFPYVAPDAVDDPAGYLLNRALPQAARAIDAAGLGAAPVAPFGGVRRLFPGIDRPTPVQSWAETVALPPGPVLAVIEDLTGSGKTEAALTLAHRLLADRRADGLFLALPTMATAGAMFGRLAGAYHRLFEASAHPSLALAHGRADLDPRFRAAIAREGEAAAPDRGRSPDDPADEAAEAHCAAWLADDRRRALLAQVGVGTIDQALLSVLPVRHAALRQRGLAGKVLIVDEAHAFDPYMNRELQTLLCFHAALGGSAILLSATLPQAVRQGLADAFREGLEAPRAALSATAYPLATLVGATGIAETPCAPREGLPRRVAVTHLPDEAAAVARIVEAASAGAAVAWVRNTVDEAIAAAAALRAQGLDPMLFHARFAMVDRLRVEAEVLRRFGRDGDPAERPGVLVATQVVEQSLDLDFDLLATDLAPMDLLIQRAGRLWRHAWRGPRPVPGPELLVVSPEPAADPPVGWLRDALPGTAAVYRDPALLWRTAREVFRRGAIATPEDMRPLIEAAYDRDAPGAVPPALARAAQEAEGKAHSATGLAAQNVLDVWKGYKREHGAWDPDTNTPTRLEERETVTLRLAVVRDGKVLPYAEDADVRRAWALSEVSVVRSRVAACPVPAGLGAAAEEARKGWGRWERESPRHLLAVVGEVPSILRTGNLGSEGLGDEDCLYYTGQEGVSFKPNPRARGDDPVCGRAEVFVCIQQCSPRSRGWPR
ncbi:CRISPR-associated helicase Cas3' [Roseomonas sp. OT10]|uniref:CRISPR-associated helicase Cas3' n=1 Tax=Roseomonas cutis TaxID=2897332 RepID=UPI001E4EFB8A|nr:CRISPR-associated helicase Cas3' [Roseomonas sp. OT10]UFN49148.1 CRISPR-associated helicase Cas3' [Roseomonas sp. OT10]